jgi:hypothetical protein
VGSEDPARSRQELAAAIAPQWRDVAIARTARKPHTCVGDAEVRKYVITVDYPEPLPGGITSAWAEAGTPEEAERRATDLLRGHRGATAIIEPGRNPNYRPDCLGSIAPGDLYVEYVGDAAMAETGRPYCLRCGLATWGETSRMTAAASVSATEPAPAAADAGTGEGLQITLVVDRAVAAGYVAGDSLGGFLLFLEERAAQLRGGRPFGLHTVDGAWLADPSVGEVTAHGTHGNVRVRLA